jgi:hypothetical protein
LTVEASLTAEGEAAWLRFKQHLAWCDSFALVFVFSDQPAVIAVLRERLAAIYRARVTGLEVPAPGTPDELLTALLPRLLHPPLYQQALNAPIWLDLARLPTLTTEAERAAWGDARLQFLARLNEQREPLRRALTKPLILVLPMAEKARIKALAPDLWAIRHFSLETGSWVVQVPPVPPVEAPARPEPFPLTATEASLVDEWRRLRRKGSQDRGALLAGGRAFDALWGRRHLIEAKEVAEWLVETARLRLEQTGETPEALRDLSVSLDNVGRTAQAQGAWEEARAAFAEGLELARPLAAALPDLPEYTDLPTLFESRLADLAEAQAAEAAPAQPPTADR